MQTGAYHRCFVKHTPKAFLFREKPLLQPRHSAHVSTGADHQQSEHHQAIKGVRCKHGVGRRGDSTRRASAAKLGSARTYALVGGATRTRAMHCGFSVATGMETRLVLRRIERALGFQWHEFMVASNENTLSKEQRFLGTSRVSM